MLLKSTVREVPCKLPRNFRGSSGKFWEVQAGRAKIASKLLPSQKNSRRLELSISKNTPHGRWGQGPGSVDQRFPADLPFPVPKILEFIAFGASGKFFQQFSRDFPGVFLGNPRTDPGNSHSLLEFSDPPIIFIFQNSPDRGQPRKIRFSKKSPKTQLWTLFGLFSGSGAHSSGTLGLPGAGGPGTKRFSGN